MDDAFSFATMAGVKKLLLAHHDPSHSDEMLNKLAADVSNHTGLPFALAAEGMEIDL